jgi:C-terminal processing protease CtpA/Prc
MDGPRTILLNRQNGAFGFTLRHFIVYPPDVHDPVVAKKLATCGLANFSQPMDTVFVKKVIPESEADIAGLREGDRLIAVNGIPVSLQFQFADIVATIQKTPKTLVIQIVPKCYDILQTVSVGCERREKSDGRRKTYDMPKEFSLVFVSVSSESKVNV